MKPCLIFLFSILAMLLLSLPFPALVMADPGTGAALFEVHCVGCHPQGNNIIRRGKNLKQRALRRNGMDSLDAIATLVKTGKNNMSAYRDRLSEAEITAVAAYVLERAAQGWR